MPSISATHAFRTGHGVSVAPGSRRHRPAAAGPGTQRPARAPSKESPCVSLDRQEPVHERVAERRNRWAGAARGPASAEAQRQAAAFQAEARQAAAFQAEAAKQVLEFWSSLFAWPPSAPAQPLRPGGAASGGRRRRAPRH